MVPKLEPEAVELDDGDMAMSSPPPEQTPVCAYHTERYPRRS